MFAWLFARPKSDLSRSLYAERYAAYQDACRRRDTRAQNEAWQALREAMNARLKAAA
jgi:hypothetical protein